MLPLDTRIERVYKLNVHDTDKDSTVYLTAVKEEENIETSSIMGKGVISAMGTLALTKLAWNKLFTLS